MSAPTIYHSVLLMESHGLAPNVRSTSFSSLKVWSKLYQAGPYFIDLMLRPGDQDLDLHGEIMTQDGSAVPDVIEIKLHNRAGPSTTVTAHNGTFSLVLGTTGSYQLDLTFDSTKLLLSDFEI